MSEFVATTAWNALFLAFEKLPGGFAYFAGDVVGRIMMYTGKTSTRHLRANLRHAGVPETDLPTALVHAWRSYMRYWVEFVRLPVWTDQMIENSVRVKGCFAMLDSELGRQSGAIIVATHQANWDILAAWIARRYSPVVTVVERVDSERMFKKFVGVREDLGVRIFSHDDRSALRALVRAASNGGVVALLVDRDLSHSGYEVDFLDGVARFPRGPAAIAERTGSLVFPVTMSYEMDVRGPTSNAESGYVTVATIHEPLSIPALGSKDERMRELTQSYASILSEGIRQSPHDWHMDADVVGM